MFVRAAGNISLSAELRDTLKLAGPIVLSQVGHMSMGLVDTLVAGRLGTTSLAGLGLASNVFWTFTSVCMGSLLALDTYFAQSAGARDERSLARYLSQAWWSSVFVTVASAIGVLAGYWAYRLLAEPSGTRTAFLEYLETIMWSLPSLFVFFILQRYWQARHRVMMFMAIILGANVLNLAACFALGLGWWGAPRLEVRGIAWATSISRYAMLVAALVYTWIQLRPASLRWPNLDRRMQRDIFRLGLPAAGQTALEVGAFTIATFVVGVLGAAPLAAHHVCLIMAAFTFMFPLGFSAAAAVRVGMFIGAGEPARARLAGWLCIGLSVSVMACFALGYWLFPRTLLGWFTTDPDVIQVGVRILVLVAIFQLADGIQVSTTGALRGLGNTRAAMVANLVGHFPIGLTLGLFLCFPLAFGAVGIWTGLAAGLISVALIVLRVWWVKTRDLSALRPIQAQPGLPVTSDASD